MMRTLQPCVRWSKGAIMAVVALGSFLGFNSSDQAKAAESFDLAEIKKAWEERQASAPSFQFTWTTEKHRAPRADVAKNEGGRMGGRTSPPQDGALTFLNSFLIDRGRFRFVNRGSVWNPNIRGYGETETTVCFDGSIARISTQCPDGEVQIGRIRDAPELREYASAVAVLFAMRPQSTLLPLDLSHYALSDREGDVDGRPCLILQRVGGEPLAMWSEIWVDPAQEFVIRRIINNGNRVRRQLDISYDRDSEERVLPTQWRDTSMTATGSLKTSTSAVVSHTFSPEVQPSDFQFIFPVGTLVFDDRDSSGEQYIVLPKEEKRIVLDAEIDAGITEDVLRVTETGEPLEVRRRTGAWVTKAGSSTPGSSKAPAK